MSQENKDKAEAAEARTQQTRGFMQQVRVAANQLHATVNKRWYYSVPPEAKSHTLSY